MVKATFLGGADEVGRMGILLETKKERFLWEYGIEVQRTLVPQKPRLPLDGVFISHAHLDHSGLTPQLYKDGYKGKVYATKPTFDLAYLLLLDSIKVQSKRGENPLFLPANLERMMHNREELPYGKPVKFKESKITLHDAGHIPGSAAPLLETEHKKILFSGDMKSMPTELVNGAKLPEKGIDTFICESTYSYKDHPSREDQGDKLREMVQETVYGGGIAVLPTFAVGRAQEMLILLHDLGFPIYMDGMGIEATEILLNNKEYLRHPQKLQKAFSKARKVRKDRDRNNIINNPCVILTTAGMMSGGPVSYYMKRLYNNQKCSLILTGYQVEGTAGNVLLKTGRFISNGIDVKPKMRIETMDFSAHTDKSHILKYLKKSNPEKVVFVHGDHTHEFAQEVKGMGFKCHAPKNGESLEL